MMLALRCAAITARTLTSAACRLALCLHCPPAVVDLLLLLLVLASYCSARWRRSHLVCVPDGVCAAAAPVSPPRAALFKGRTGARDIRWLACNEMYKEVGGGMGGPLCTMASPASTLTPVPLLVPA